MQNIGETNKLKRYTVVIIVLFETFLRSLQSYSPRPTTDVYGAE